MTTATAARATRISDIAVDADRLVAEIEQYLAASTRATAHPLVTKTTSELVAEALAGLDTPQAPAAKAPQLTPPSALLRRLPEWVLSSRCCAPGTEEAAPSPPPNTSNSPRS